MATTRLPDLAHAQHLIRNQVEDVAWLLSNGESLDHALAQVGLTHDAYEQHLYREARKHGTADTRQGPGAGQGA